MKKVSILTQPLGHNYGGLIQAYALQCHLKGMGCDVETLDRRASSSPASVFVRYAVNCLRLFLGRIKSVPTEARLEYVYKNLIEFRDKNLHISRRIDSEAEIRGYYGNHKFDALLVGSDQVWRPKYSPSLYNFFLDFLEDVSPTPLRISYAASFGVDDWEYRETETKLCGELLRNFDAISVRESSAKKLCEERFGVSDVKIVLDPTFLLDPEEYRNLVTQKFKVKDRKGVYAYILDNSKTSYSMVEHVSTLLGLSSYSVKPRDRIEDVRRRNISACQYPSVEKWLSGFLLADFVVTDSFHGCVFSIIFNKPFVALANSGRGMSRFNSLLNTFGLQDRLLAKSYNLEEIVYESIDWNSVNSILEDKSAESKEFLMASLLRSSCSV